MMRTFRCTSQFKKDIKRMEKRGKGFTEFKEVLTLIIHGQMTDEKYRDHALIGQYADAISSQIGC